MQFSAKSVRDPLYDASLGGNVKTSACSDGYFSYMNSDLLSCGNFGFDQISCLKAVGDAAGSSL